MATHDRMDLDVRSQAFLKDFYHFHKNTCDAWYIKDANHRFMDASITFLSRFSPPDLTSVQGLSDADVAEASARDIALMHEFESLVMSQDKEIVILAWDYFTDCNEIKSFILKMKPWHYVDNIGVIVYIADLTEINKETNWFSSLVPEDENNFINYNFRNRQYQAPLFYLTEKEWGVAWLLICGCTMKWISVYFNLSERTIENKAISAYMKLRVSNRIELVKAAEYFGWINFIPKRFLTSPSLIRIL
ncbi:helix-turn-helix transcriptional regulator [Raoultella ornithinolytica]|uniref:helix-turn-helix transcriptional regulator n=1 Tax=Raoultella ornithinolytica TaxID=54291 RepID=UPI00255AFA34|nr:helix-turn-helix transcriptional regulator [Raoultella ornithinolytica]MDL4585362.1 helix-turn-helix transcriptional regulator [Raoultella ornithinolytica]MDV1095660.1 helix-turn-helix transcriptional regulator [Raoultella ornithinolytica]MDV1123211.1 helix-turn-helix transcriptional regulator [Raoultella ornithinolytica]MDV1893571.1 helix-turn-helix transcriptional regulator [Raoultella ornithinolytica]HEC2564926.1 helix-turn-helix transcriptional regulator [Raoultella ornithinolytica]